MIVFTFHSGSFEDDIELRLKKTNIVKGIHYQSLCDLKYEPLTNLLYLYYHAEYAGQYAAMVKNLPGISLFIKLLEEAKKCTMQIKGIDLIEEHCYANNITDVKQIIEKDFEKVMTFSERDQEFFKNLCNIRENTRGIVVLVGATHLVNLLNFLDMENISHVSYIIHLSTPFLNDNSDVVTELNTIGLIDDKEFIERHRFQVDNENDMSLFIKKALEQVSTKNIQTNLFFQDRKKVNPYELYEQGVQAFHGKDFNKSKEKISKALNKLEKNNSPKKDIANCHSTLASIYRELSQIDLAISHASLAVNMRMEVMGKEDPLTIKAQSKLDSLLLQNESKSNLKLS